METITVHIDDYSNEVLDALRNAIDRAADAIGETAVGYAKDYITRQGAVDTGNLRNSITKMVREE